jgi:transcriptional regulator NrdR family protein
MNCPECGEDTLVSDSRNKKGKCWRRRKCPNNHRFTTWEIPIGEIESFKEEMVIEQVRLAMTESMPLLAEALTAVMLGNLRRNLK